MLTAPGKYMLTYRGVYPSKAAWVILSRSDRVTLTMNVITFNHTAPGVCGTAIKNVLVVAVETADKNDNERY